MAEFAIVPEFDVESGYVSKFEVHTVGSSMHQELRVPAEELEEFNRHIVGQISVIVECTVEGS